MFFQFTIKNSEKSLKKRPSHSMTVLGRQINDFSPQFDIYLYWKTAHGTIEALKKGRN